jgi:iron-sulfur cluster assembly accessory protein
MQTGTEQVIEVTEGAARKARSLAEHEGRPGAALRVRVVAGGCSGFSYRLGFEDGPAEDDEVVEAHGLRVLIDPRSAPIVRGSTLDFNDSLLGGGLKMLNPQAVQECACGESFSI